MFVAVGSVVAYQLGCLKKLFLLVGASLLLYKVAHHIAGALIVPSCRISFLVRSCRKQGERSLVSAQELREGIMERHIEKEDWKFKRITVEADGYKIDALVVGCSDFLSNGRWMLCSSSREERYEDILTQEGNRGKSYFAAKMEANLLLFNYPGVGASSGFPDREAMAKAYRAMLSFLEDKEKGIGANEIIGYGYGLGAAVQGDALQNHRLREDVKYVFIKDRTFSDLASAVSALKGSFFAWLVWWLGWNMSSIESSKRLNAHEIVTQTVSSNQVPDGAAFETIQSNGTIVDNGIVAKEAALAYLLLEDPENSICSNKTFLGVKDDKDQPSTLLCGENPRGGSLVDLIKRTFASQQRSS